MKKPLQIPLFFDSVLLLLSFAEAQNAKRKGRANKQQQQQWQKKKQQQPATSPMGRAYGVQLTDDSGYHTAPAVAETADGSVHVAWIQYVEGQGDSVVTR